MNQNLYQKITHLVAIFDKILYNNFKFKKIKGNGDYSNGTNNV